ncbi:MAG: DUF5011 domain-containing protein, partial [Candidatus Niyogibacteria bacterium]|nr:DUF5011 domain-containing protein [Candidatus Niyogibacteria bacterium]
ASSSIGAGLQVAGALNASSSFQVAGASVFGGALTVNSGNLANFIGGFISNASSSIGANLNVFGPLSASSSLAVNGLSLLQGGFISNASSSIGARLNVSGIFAASSTVYIGGGSVIYTSAATTTIANNEPYAWTLATSTTANPIIQVDTRNIGGTATVTIGSIGAGSIIIGDIGSASNLVFEESSTIHGQGGNTLTFGTAGDIINFAVNIGIGTTTPGAALDIIGALCVDDSTPTCQNAVRTAGTIYAVATSITGIDIAETYPTKDPTLKAGEIVTTDPANPVFVKRAEINDQPIGVVSTAPGIELGGYNEVLYANEIKVPVALAGRVPVRVNLTGGEIHVGDKIAVANAAGYGKRADMSAGVIGTALEDSTASSTKSVILVLMDTDYRYVESQLYVNPESGNIGIGGFDGKTASTTPQYKLHVLGEVAAQGFVNISTRDAKENINYLGDSNLDSILKKVKDAKPAAYNYIGEDEFADDEKAIRPRLGLIAEEAPPEVLSVDGRGVDLYKLSTFNLAAIKALAGKLDLLEARIAALEAGGTRNSSSGSGGPPAGGLSFGAILKAFDALKAKFADGYAAFKNLVAETLTIGSREKPSGITLYDEATGEPYCLKVVNGQTQTAAGACANVETPSFETPFPSESEGPANLEASLPSGSEASTDAEPPVITLLGNNPAEIEIGSIYGDLGATVTDNVDDNLGYKVRVDGGPEIYPNEIQIDTSAAGEHTIIYKAIDNAGNIGTAERIVRVIDPNPAPADTAEIPAESPAEETATTTEQI